MNVRAFCKRDDDDDDEPLIVPAKKLTDIW